MPPSKFLTTVSLAAVLLVFFSQLASTTPNTPPSSKAILLSTVRTLTLRANKETSHRRVSAIPQLRCAGGNACDLYAVDAMQCTNQGADYDDENIQWTCVADLPAEFKLGGTEVVCEGYRSAEDDWVLKGSCGVEYRLLLTDKGEERFGKRRSADGLDGRTWGEWGRDMFHMLKVIAILLGGFFLIAMFFEWLSPNSRRGLVQRGTGWGGGGGGGGGGGPDDPPPPYDWQPPRKPSSSSSSSRSTGAAGGGWEPGFWTGALGGAAAGYAMGNRGGQNRGNGEGSSRNVGRGSGLGSSSFSSGTRESTGFGGTSRR